MAYKRRWCRSAITCIAGGNCERFSVQWVCKVAEFRFVNYFFTCGKDFVVSYWFTTDPYAVAYQRVYVINMALVAMETTAVRHYPIITKT